MPHINRPHRTPEELELADELERTATTRRAAAAAFEQSDRELERRATVIAANLHHVHGWSFADLAEIMGVSKQRVHQMVQRRA